MADRYQQFVDSPPGRVVSKQLGLPRPVQLRRYEPGPAGLPGPALIGAAQGGRLVPAIGQTLDAVRADTRIAPDNHVQQAAAAAKLGAQTFVADADDDTRFAAIVYDATGIARSEDLRELYSFFHSVIRRVQTSGRAVVLGTPPEKSASAREWTAQRALEGFVRSVGKEIGGGSTAQLVYVSPGAE